MPSGPSDESTRSRGQRIRPGAASSAWGRGRGCTTRRPTPAADRKIDDASPRPPPPRMRTGTLRGGMERIAPWARGSGRGGYELVVHGAQPFDVAEELIAGAQERLRCAG